MSLAEAKLARQNKRIEQAEAALTAPPPPEAKHRQVSRGGKGKTVWKAFDFAADTTPTATEASAAGNAEIRISTFPHRPEIRDSSLSRSLSSLSQRTAASNIAGAEKLDSYPRDHADLQLYTGQRGRRGTDYLSAYEDKSERKQKTMEASIDTRGIYEVFGNALPGSDFIDENPGMKNGQLQFVQHPNGDVSAHQWSAERYVWENIGQWSNVREKVEGQLAADRLKGETAGQTLQQNTLAYFRTIAKQREAVIMGLPFGTKEILQMLPHPRPTPAHSGAAAANVHQHSVRIQPSAEPRLSATSSDANQSNTHYAAHAYTQSMEYAAPVYAAYPGYVPAPLAYGGCLYNAPYQYPVDIRADRYGNPVYYGMTPAPMYDPFLGSAQPHRSTHNSLMGARSSQAGGAELANRTKRPTEEQSALNYDCHFPPAGATSKSVRAAEGRRADSSQLHHEPPPATAYTTGPAPSQSPFVGPAGTELGTIPSQAQEAPEGDTQFHRVLSVPRINTPGRNGMLDQLMKISDQAKERSLSQTNIRTVLFDPFRTGSEDVAPTPVMYSTAKKVATPQYKKTVANPSGISPNLERKTAQVTDTYDDLPILRSLRKGSTRDDSILQTSSSPETYWSKKDSDTTPYLSSASQPRERLLVERFTDKSTTEILAQLDADAKLREKSTQKSCDQKLRDWCLNGSTFARHEDLFKSLKALDKDSEPDLGSSPSSHYGAIGTPVKKSSPLPSATTVKSDAMTRMLIPVWENLASYMQGPFEKRRDYFSQWKPAPEWAIDRNGNTSFYDKDWGCPPARVGRDPRYRPLPQGTIPDRYVPRGRMWVENVRFGNFGSPTVTADNGLAVNAGLERRFAYGRM